MDGKVKRRVAFISKSSIEQNGTNRRVAWLSWAQKAPSDTQAGGAERTAKPRGCSSLSRLLVEKTAFTRKAVLPRWHDARPTCEAARYDLLDRGEGSIPLAPWSLERGAALHTRDQVIAAIYRRYGMGGVVASARMYSPETLRNGFEASYRFGGSRRRIRP